MLALGLGGLCRSVFPSSTCQKLPEGCDHVRTRKGTGCLLKVNGNGLSESLNVSENITIC